MPSWAASRVVTLGVGLIGLAMLVTGGLVFASDVETVTGYFAAVGLISLGFGVTVIAVIPQMLHRIGQPCLGGGCKSTAYRGGDYCVECERDPMDDLPDSVRIRIEAGVKEFNDLGSVDRRVRNTEHWRELHRTIHLYLPSCLDRYRRSSVNNKDAEPRLRSEVSRSMRLFDEHLDSVRELLGENIRA